MKNAIEKKKITEIKKNTETFCAHITIKIRRKNPKKKIFVSLFVTCNFFWSSNYYYYL